MSAKDSDYKMKPDLNKGFNKIFNRLTITILLVLIQCAWYVILLQALQDYSSWIIIIFTVIAGIMSLFIIWRDENPAYKIGWILLICLLPVLGTTMYLFFGNKRPAKSLIRKIAPQDILHREDLKQVENVKGDLSRRLFDTVRYLSNMGPYPAWKNTDVKYYTVGDIAYVDMLSDLKNAKHFIFMEYFILSEGKMWHEIYGVLKDKAESGVDVRIIYDDFGSINTLPKQFVKRMEADGIKAMPFNRIRPILAMVYNNRDHRKILVIDGYIAHSGGYNIADEYINIIERFGHWKDTGFRLKGDAVWNYTVMFLNMWNSFRKTDYSYDMYRPHVQHPEEFQGKGVIQPYSDSPLDDENIGENVYLEILSQAEDYVYIFTPYLIIDNEMKTSLVLAAKRGVDVRIVTPGIPDKKMIFRLTRSYYEPLIKAGVKIYEYTPGFMHAKSYISDDRIGVVGTINMDYRSLFLHFECGTLMIDCPALKDLKKDCLETIEKSRQIHHEDCRRGFFGLLFDGVLRVLSPLL